MSLKRETSVTGFMVGEDELMVPFILVEEVLFALFKVVVLKGKGCRSALEVLYCVRTPCDSVTHVSLGELVSSLKQFEKQPFIVIVRTWCCSVCSGASGERSVVCIIDSQ